MEEGQIIKCECGSVLFCIMATMKHFGSNWGTKIVCSKCKKQFNFTEWEDKHKETE